MGAPRVLRRLRATLARVGIGTQDIDPMTDSIVVTLGNDVGFSISLLTHDDSVQITPLYRNELSVRPDGSSIAIQTKLKQRK